MRHAHLVGLFYWFGNLFGSLGTHEPVVCGIFSNNNPDVTVGLMDNVISGPPEDRR